MVVDSLPPQAQLGSVAAASPGAVEVAGPPSPSAPRSWEARRARAWYSGPCLRGSAYSRGLIVQYVFDDGPYHAPPSHSGSSGVSFASS